jgi:integral membrane sensor domain MASE1
MKKYLTRIASALRPITERALRGGVAAVVGAYVAGDLVFNQVNMSSLNDWLAVFVGGALTSLALALGITSATGSPALNKQESFDKHSG